MIKNSFNIKVELNKVKVTFSNSFYKMLNTLFVFYILNNKIINNLFVISIMIFMLKITNNLDVMNNFISVALMMYACYLINEFSMKVTSFDKYISNEIEKLKK